MEPQSKPFWKSKFIWGAVLTLLQMFLKKKGIDIPAVGDFGQYATEAFAAYGLRDSVGGGLTLKIIALLFISTFMLSSCGMTSQTTAGQKPLEYGIDKIESYNDSTVYYFHIKATGITPDNVGIIIGDISDEKIIVESTTFDNTGLGARGRVIIKK